MLNTRYSKSSFYRISRNIVTINLSLPIAEVSKKIKEACCTKGVFYIKGHQVNNAHEAFKQMNNFFALSKEEKEKVKISKEVEKDGFNRGYIGIGEESGDPELFELKEAFRLIIFLNI